MRDQVMHCVDAHAMAEQVGEQINPRKLESLFSMGSLGPKVLRRIRKTCLPRRSIPVPLAYKASA